MDIEKFSSVVQFDDEVDEDEESAWLLLEKITYEQLKERNENFK